MKNTTLSFVLLIVSAISINAQEISADFPFESKYIDVFGSKMHYVEEYKDESNPNQTTFLFLHGNPTSNYLWRNIIPYVEGEGRAIAPDLIGMGKSDKPDIAYTFQDHIKYLDEFIRQMKTDKIILVIHDWGSALGFHYAYRNQDKIQGIVFMEAVTEPITKENATLVQKMIFKRIRDDEKGHEMIVENNFFIENIVYKTGTKRKLTEEEKAYYGAPFQTEESRKLMHVFAQEIPFEGPAHHNYETIHTYSEWLKETTIPKLFLYATPGMVVNKKQVKKIKSEMKNLQTVYVGKGKHYIQEDAPHEIGLAMKNWVEGLELN